MTVNYNKRNLTNRVLNIQIKFITAVPPKTKFFISTVLAQTEKKNPVLLPVKSSKGMYVSR